MSKGSILENAISKLGGPGSGNRGHAGRPGHRGGSAPKGGGIAVGSVSDAADTLRKEFGVTKRDFEKDGAVTLRDKYSLPEIYSKLESLGLTKMEKPSYAQSFDIAWYRVGDRVVRVAGRGLVRGTEKWKSLLVFDM